MELPLQLFGSLVNFLTINDVSILVLMELPLQLTDITGMYTKLFVSILVLMELPLQLMVYVNKALHQLGFNPCFNGTTSATITTPKRKELGLEFQSLF